MHAADGESDLSGMTEGGRLQQYVLCGMTDFDMNIALAPVPVFSRGALIDGGNHQHGGAAGRPGLSQRGFGKARAVATFGDAFERMMPGTADGFRQSDASHCHIPCCMLQSSAMIALQRMSLIKTITMN